MDSRNMSPGKKPIGDIKTSLAATGRRLSSLVYRYVRLNIILLFIALEIMVFSIEQAKWIWPQPSFTVTLVLSMLAAWLLTRPRIPRIIAHVATLVAGAAVILGQALFLLPAAGPGNKWALLLSSLQTFGLVEGVNLSFAVTLCIIVWLVGYVSTWFLLRRQNVWIGVFLGTFIILVNLSNLPGDYYYFFVIFMIAASLLIVQNRLAAQVRTVRSVWRPATAILLVIVIAASALAWVIPNPRLPRLETAIASNMLWTQDIENSRLNPFSQVPAKQPKNTASTQRGVGFSGGWTEGDKLLFIVNSSHPSYWRVKTYDTYTSGGWINTPTQRLLQPREEAVAETSENDTITYTVTTQVNTNVILTAGDFVKADTAAVLHIGAGGYIVGASVPRLLISGESYTVTSGVALTASERLAAAGSEYPDSITGDYLQLPDDFPESVRELALEITEDKESPYDKVLVINRYLSQFPYAGEVEAPPPGQDGVEHFLFSQKSGFCLYFASAMAVMLRSVDVPSRLVLGYLPGDRGEVSGEYLLKFEHYHAWPQAYFPGFGWVDIEVTPRADILTAAATPWVSDRLSGGEWSPDYTWQDWEAYLRLIQPVDVTLEVDDLTPSGIRGRWPFADALGKVLLSLFIIGILAGVVALFIYLRQSGFYRGLWRVDRANCAAAVYERMCALGAMAGITPVRQQTPLEYAAALAAAFPRQEAAVYNITRAYVENRFAGKVGKLDLFEEAEILKARCGLFGSILERLSLGDRLFCRWK